jgi:hypothetical protein
MPLALVELLLAVDPFHEIYLRRDMNFDAFKPRAGFWDEDKRDLCDQRAEVYDGPRVRFFRDRYQAGAQVPPVHFTVDPSGMLKMFNGYHRLCGAILAEQEQLRCIFHIPGYDPKGASRSLDRIRREARRASRSK